MKTTNSQQRLKLRRCLIAAMMALAPVATYADVTFTGNVTPNPSSGNVSPNVLNVGSGGVTGSVTVTNTGAPVSLTSGQASPPLPNPVQQIAANIFDGSVTVNGGSWFNNGAMGVGIGAGATATVIVENSGSIISHGDLMGVTPGSFGAMVVQTGGSWTANNFLTVGTSGTGSALVQSGGQLIAPIVNVGINAGSNGSMLVTGAGSMVRGANTSLNVGTSGTGAATFAQGAGLEGLFITVGRSNGGVGTLNIDGAGTTATLSGAGAFMTVGRESGGQGTANITNGAQVNISSTTAAAVGFQAGREGGTGLINVSGGASINVTGDQVRTHIGRGASGTLNITDAGTVKLSGTSTAGAVMNVGNTSLAAIPTPGNGIVNISGAGSALIVESKTGQATVNVGLNGNTGVLNVSDHGAVYAKDVIIGANGTLTGGDGVINAQVTVNGGIIAPGNSPGMMTINGDLIFNSGTLSSEIAGLSIGQFDVLNINGLASFTAGTFAFSFLDGFLPTTSSQWTFLTASNGITGWENLGLSVAGLSGDYTYFLSSDGYNLNFNVNVTPVPEPEIYAMMAIGLGFLGFIRRRKAQYAA